MAARRLRSCMFVPGNNERFVAKGVVSAADAIFLDLEDGVPPAHKAEARKLVAAALGRPPGGPMRLVRVNAVSTPWFDDDVAEVIVPGLAGVVLPKVEHADDVAGVASLLAGHEERTGMPAGSVPIVVAIESAAGLLRAHEIATSHERVLALMFGAEDFALDLGLGTHREGEARELTYARSALVVAAAAARVLSIDGVFPDLDDEEGLVADAVQARRLGFDAKSTFNPRQLDLLNRVFSPSDDELDYARTVVAAFEEAQQRGDGSVAVGGQLVDLPIVRRAQRLLETTA